MERQGKQVDVTEAAVNLLTEKGYNTAYGARFLKRHIDEKGETSDYRLVENVVEFQSRR